MWTKLPISTISIDCRPPFSFFFDLIQRFWKTPFDQSNKAPFHRICTLARKMGVQSILIESVLDRVDIEQEISDLDKALGGNGKAEAIAINFFSDNLVGLQEPSPSEDTFLGQAVLINYRTSSQKDFSHSYIYETIFRSPRLTLKDSQGNYLNLLNNYIHSKNDYEVEVCGQKFSVNGVYFCQQNNVTSVCAHACLKMSINAINSNKRWISTHTINQLLGISSHFPGLSLEQIKLVLEGNNFNPRFYDCRGIDPAQYLSVLHSLVGSGFPSLLVFSTKDQIDHVVTVFGHTLNTDEWHPQALPVYSGPGSAQYYPSSYWVDHFLIHDDNFGPYSAFSSRSLSMATNTKAKWIVGLFPSSVLANPLAAESLSASLLTRIPVLLPDDSGRWGEYLRSKNSKYVLRTFLAERNAYIEHLKCSKAHDSSKMKEDEIIYLNNLPDKFWITEYSLPDLYMGNKAKLGEVLFDSIKPVDPQNPFSSLLGFRGPGTLLLVNGGDNTERFPLSIISHSPVYRRFLQSNEW